MIRNDSNKLYVGVTKDPKSRVRYHNTRRGAKFTKHVPNFLIAFLEQHETLADARKREIQIKKWRREKKEVLIGKFQKSLPTL